ncbi:SPARC [Anopheles gambiae]|uniref:SPARC/Testican calcium-binding domain-containing protein n=2 Tax=gambiae species complex TaxID=44542 RepID=A0A6E8V8D9_ANOCL|nr:SPARC [Anopheles gambiae]XP_040240085.1 SPARC [Anopheles coluzzii]
MASRMQQLVQLTVALVALVALLHTPPAHADDIDELLNEFDEEDEELLRHIESQHVSRDYELEDQMARELANRIAAEHYGQPDGAGESDDAGPIEGRVPRLIDPCKGVRCGAGRVCRANVAEQRGECVCIPECPPETDPRRKVCTNRNETWDSACEVHRQRCLCNTADPGCRHEELRHVHIDYYGTCREMPECSENDLADFPRRMRDWLFNVMRDLALRNELPDAYLALEHEAESNMTKRWTNAAIWKWCELDGHPHDNTVSRHELFPIRAPLFALEHCIAPFLESCDPNRDHRISLQEWGKCLELEEDDLTARCAEIAKDEEANASDLHDAFV